jgi:DNA-binding CsgD family transcriptional regulator
MTAGYQALTEKEKETLRLLIGGHDAKSIARALGLSIHTVNERLRDARRKMAVTSSREAARLMRAAEGKDPNSIVDNQLGDAATAEVVSPHTQSAPQPRRLGWLIGGVVMSISFALLAFAALTDQARPPVAPASSAMSATESAPVIAARQWLELGDRSDWAASYATTAASFRSVNTLENWQKAAVSVRVPLGQVVRREVVAEVDVPTPPGGNMVVKFRTDFANKAGTVETVALAREGSVWRVVGVYVE